MASHRELVRLAEVQRRDRARQLQAMQERLAVALSNEVGFNRLRAITDEEWEAAVLAGEPVGEA